MEAGSDFQNIFLVEGGSTIGGFGVGFDFEAFTNATAMDTIADVSNKRFGGDSFCIDVLRRR